MYRHFKFFALTAALVLPTLLNPVWARDVEAGVESPEAILHLRDGTNGYILVRDCAECKQIRLKIDANTQAFASNRPVDVRDTPRRAASAITVIYDPTSMTAKRIRWAQ